MCWGWIRCKVIKCFVFIGLCCFSRAGTREVHNKLEKNRLV